MTYKQFVQWCNDRACDGCWSANTAIFCSSVIDMINKFKFKYREKEWQSINEAYAIVDKIVNPINEKILKCTD